MTTQITYKEGLEKVLEKFDNKWIYMVDNGFGFQSSLTGRLLWSIDGEDFYADETIKDFLTTNYKSAYLAGLEAAKVVIESSNNFNQATIDGKEDWNEALKQSGAKVTSAINDITTLQKEISSI